MAKNVNTDIKLFMIKRGVTQRDLAKFIGIHYTTVCRRINSVMTKEEKDTFKRSVAECAEARGDIGAR